MNDSTQRLRDAVETFLARHELCPTRFGEGAASDPSFVSKLMRGRSLRLVTADRVLAFMGEAPVGPALSVRGRGLS